MFTYNLLSELLFVAVVIVFAFCYLLPPHANKNINIIIHQQPFPEPNPPSPPSPHNPPLLLDPHLQSSLQCFGSHPQTVPVFCP